MRPSAAARCREFLRDEFQVDFAPAQSAVRTHVVESLFAPLEPLYNDAIGREVDRISRDSATRTWRSV